MSLIDAREAVANSVEVLDRHFQNDEWLDNVDEVKLDMTSMNKCIMGQVFGDYDKGCRVVGVPDVMSDTYAFTEGYSFSFEEAAQAWRELIRERRASRQPKKEEAGDANVNLQVVKRYIPDPTQAGREVEIIVMATFNKDIAKGAIMALNNAGIKCRCSETTVVE